MGYCFLLEKNVMTPHALDEVTNYFYADSTEI